MIHSGSFPGIKSEANANRSAVRRPQVPARWREEVARVLITEANIAKRVRAMSLQIQHDFTGREMVIVSLLNGTVMFLADLIRHISLPLRLDFMGVSSYGAGTTPGELVFTKELRLDVRDRDVLLVDDILDTGKTMTHVLKHMSPLGARSTRICVLLDKPSRRVEQVHADYVGFQIPDEFVVGYGLDYAERFRNLPFVGVLQEGVYREGTEASLKAEKARLTQGETVGRV
jgi:hypoxanthine phosphoribosyltransferase